MKEVTKQDSLTIVQLEPQSIPLLFENKIPPGCIQHIILALLKRGKESNEVCDKMCNILCKINLDNSASRK